MTTLPTEKELADKTNVGKMALNVTNNENVI